MKNKTGLIIEYAKIKTESTFYVIVYFVVLFSFLVHHYNRINLTQKNSAQIKFKKKKTKSKKIITFTAKKNINMLK